MSAEREKQRTGRHVPRPLVPDVADEGDSRGTAHRRPSIRRRTGEASSGVGPTWQVALTTRRSFKCPISRKQRPRQERRRRSGQTAHQASPSLISSSAADEDAADRWTAADEWPPHSCLLSIRRRGRVASFISRWAHLTVVCLLFPTKTRAPAPSPFCWTARSRNWFSSTIRTAKYP